MVKNKTKTIWFIHPYGVTPEYPASTRHYYFGDELVKLGWDVVLWQSSFINPTKAYHNGTKYRQLKIEKLSNGVNLAWLWGSPYFKNNIYRSLNMIVWAVNLIVSGFLWGLLKKTPDIILVSSPHIFSAVSGRVLSRVFKKPLVLEVRDLWPDTLKDMGSLSDGIMSRVLFYMEKRLYKESSHIIALTEGIKNRIVEKGVKPHKVTFLPNGIHLGSSGLSGAGSSKEDIRKNLNLSDKFICIYAGAHGPSNALDSVVEAARLLDDENIVFLMVGDGLERPALMDKARRLGLKNIVFQGPVPKCNVSEYIAASNICLLTLKNIPVFQTALPNKIFDYMYLDKPVICAVKGEVAELIEKNKLGIVVEPENPKELALAVLKLKGSAGFIEQLGKGGYKLVTQEYSFEKLSFGLASILDRILKF